METTAENPFEAAADASAADSSPSGDRRPSEEFRKYRFEDMKLRVGDRLHLQLPARVTTERLTARVIGFVDGRVLLITMPESRTGRMRLVEGEEVVVRAFCGSTAFGFKSTVQRLLLTPIEYVHLSFPGNIQGVTIRKSPRVRIQVQVKVQVPGRPEAAGSITNISATGALVDTPRPLGEPGDRIQVAFHLRLFDLDLGIDTGAVIRSVASDPNPAPGATGAHHHGIEFEDLKPNDRLALYSLIYQQITDNPESVI